MCTFVDQVIQTHFWIKRNEIMQTVANWITELESQSGDERTQRSIQLNLMALKVTTCSPLFLKAYYNTGVFYVK